MYEYPDGFDLSLIDKYGWYAAKNKGDNPNGITRDHMISVKRGWDSNISPDIIAHPANCKLMRHLDNIKKNVKSSIEINELITRIDNWLN